MSILQLTSQPFISSLKVLTPKELAILGQLGVRDRVVQTLVDARLLGHDYDSIDLLGEKIALRPSIVVETAA